MKTPKSLLASLAVALASGAAVHASVIVAYDGTSTRPDEDQILATLNPDNLPTSASISSYTWRRNSAAAGSNWNRAISFQAGSGGTLDELGIYVTGPGGGGGGNSIQILIRETSSAPTSPTAGTVVLNTTATIDVSGDSSPGILKFAFDEDSVISLTEDRWYTVSLIWDATATASSVMNFSLRDTASGLDGEGNVVSVGSWRANPGGSWVSQSGNNVLFYAATNQAIPEPSTVAMLGLAGVAFALYRRRKSS